jgi:hypothetical protein
MESLIAQLNILSKICSYAETHAKIEQFDSKTKLKKQTSMKGAGWQLEIYPITSQNIPQNLLRIPL